jgi:ArsR family transcriptional regulator, arsenate/arsenite/antimonite-responsive transcriptional repressor
LYSRYVKNTANARASATSGPEQSAQLFHALSDATRLSILDMLRDGERCVCDLQDALDAAQSRLSFHLKVLRDAGLVSDRKDGRWSYYTAKRERLAEAEQVIAELARPRAGLVALRRGGRVRSGASASAAPQRGCC